MALRVHGDIPDDRIQEIADFVRGQSITEAVFRDLDAAGLSVAEIIPMDEYTLDWVVPLPDGLTLVYDTT